MVTFTQNEVLGTIGDRLAKIVAETPDKTALIEGADSWTFKAFLDESMAYARPFSRLSGAGPVALMLGQSARTLFALYGGILAGVPVVPIDIESPPEGLAEVLANCRLLLTEPAGRDKTVTLVPGLPVVTTLEELTAIAGEGPVSVAGPTNRSAAVIYLTSGSTGVPKGTAVDHARALHTAWARAKAQHFSGHARLGQIRSFAFGGSAHIIFTGLLNGATIVLANFREMSKEAFATLVETENISDLNLTPSHLRALAGHLAERGSRWQPQIVTLSGEPLFYEDLEAIRSGLGWTCPIVNRFACSEVGVVAEWVVASDAVAEHDVVPVGRSFDDCLIEILDTHGKAVPPGETGEIAVTGRFTSREYWNDEARSSERFEVINAADHLCRVRTGDLGMLDSDGLLHHMGRRDTQVKIRGHRVELRSIERTMRRVPGVANAAVAANKTPRGDTCLVGHAESISSTGLTEHGLRQALSGMLPGYAIPRKLMVMDRLPTTAGGKVNYASLPPPGRERPSGLPEIARPVGETESRIARIWTETLEIDDIGRDDDYFELGGDSLDAMTLALRLQEEFNLVLDEVELLMAPTVRNIATIISANSKDRAADAHSPKSTVQELRK